MEMFEHAESCSCLGILRCGWVQVRAQELSRTRAYEMTVAVVKPNAMDSINVNDYEVVVKRFGRIEAALTGWVVKLNP